MHDLDWTEHTARRPRRFQVFRLSSSGRAVEWVGASDEPDEARGLARTRKPTVVLEGGELVLRVPERGPCSGPLSELAGSG